MQLLLHYSRTLPLRQAGKTTSRDLSNLSALCQTPRVIFTGWTIPSASCMLPLPLSPVARTRCNSCGHNLAPYTLALFGLRFCSQKTMLVQVDCTVPHCTVPHRTASYLCPCATSLSIILSSRASLPLAATSCSRGSLLLGAAPFCCCSSAHSDRQPGHSSTYHRS